MVAGGLGGLGRAILLWMAERGVKHLIVPSRSGASSQAAVDVVHELEKRGVNIVTPKCDASSASQVAGMMEDCTRTMPPIKGCINAAMVLQVFLIIPAFEVLPLTLINRMPCLTT